MLVERDDLGLLLEPKLHLDSGSVGQSKLLLWIELVEVDIELEGQLGRIGGLNANSENGL